MKDFSIKSLAFVCLLAACLAGCEKVVEPVDEKPLTLSVSRDSVYCLPVYNDLPALEIGWTAGSNHGTGSAIAYTFEMDREGNNFGTPMTIAIGRTADRTLVFGHKSLADTLKQVFPGIQDKQYNMFECRIKAIILQTGEVQTSNVVKVAIACNSSMITELFLVGDATPNGWDLSRATPMILDMQNLETFTWTGQMYKGEFKLLLTTDDWLPCYVRDSTNTAKMILRQTEQDYPDFKWTIDKNGMYTVAVDTKSLNLTVTWLGGESYTHIYMIGDATPGGWSWDNVTEMAHPETNIFTWQGTLGAGQIKFPTEIRSDWSGEMLFAPVPDCTPAQLGKFDAHVGDPDNKWLISEPGQWSIRINISDTTISFVKL